MGAVGDAQAQDVVGAEARACPKMRLTPVSWRSGSKRTDVSTPPTLRPST